MSSSDKNRLRKTYSFFRPQPVFASGGGGGGGGGGICEQFWYSTTNDSIYTTGSVAIRGGDTTLDDPADKGTDVFFYVSGSSFTATDFSLFGGDVFVSGSVISLGDLIEVTGSIIATEGISGSLTTLSDGTSYLVAGTNITIVSESNGSITISSTAGGGGDSFFTSTTADSIFTTGSVAIRGQESIDSPVDKGTDVFFYVSGSRGSKDGSTSGVALFEGDVAISGSSFFEGDYLELSGTFAATEGISGSLTRLTDGTSYLIAGPNITILSQSNGSISISGSAPVTFRFLAGTVASGQPSGSMQSVGMDYLDQSMIVGSNKSYIFKAILAKTTGTTAYMDLYDYDGIIGGTPGPISGSVLTGSNESYTHLTADLTSAFAAATTSGIIEARIWCDPTGAGLNAICKNAKLEII